MKGSTLSNVEGHGSTALTGGDYEGLTLKQILVLAPGWMIFNDGCPGGESPDQIGARVDRAIARVRRADGHVALFAHGHVFRVFAARWLGLPPSAGAAPEAKNSRDTRSGRICQLGVLRP